MFITVVYQLTVLSVHFYHTPHPHGGVRVLSVRRAGGDFTTVGHSTPKGGLL